MQNLTISELIFLLVFTVFIGAVLLFYIFLLARSMTALRWQKTDGEILNLEIQESDGDINSGPTYTPFIKYKYTVDNMTYISKTLGYGLWGTTFLSLTERTLNNVCTHPLSVYYNPENHGTALLVRGLTLHHTVCLALIGSTFAISYYFLTNGL